MENGNGKPPRVQRDWLMLWVLCAGLVLSILSSVVAPYFTGMATLQAKVDQLSTMPAKVDQLSTMQARVDQMASVVDRVVVLESRVATQAVQLQADEAIIKSYGDHSLVTDAKLDQINSGLTTLTAEFQDFKAAYLQQSSPHPR